MTANPLKAQPRFKSKRTARQWAQSARDRGLMDVAVQWEKADRECWDAFNYDAS